MDTYFRWRILKLLFMTLRISYLEYFHWYIKTAFRNQGRFQYRNLPQNFSNKLSSQTTLENELAITLARY